jgi:hypothetical protein
MIDIRAQRQPHFTHNLRPNMERRVSILPSFESKFRPEVLLGTSSAAYVHIPSAEIKQVLAANHAATVPGASRQWRLYAAKRLSGCCEGKTLSLVASPLLAARFFRFFV